MGIHMADTVRQCGTDISAIGTRLTQMNTHFNFVICVVLGTLVVLVTQAGKYNINR